MLEKDSSINPFINEDAKEWNDFFDFCEKRCKEVEKNEAKE